MKPACPAQPDGLQVSRRQLSLQAPSRKPTYATYAQEDPYCSRNPKARVEVKISVANTMANTIDVYYFAIYSSFINV